MLLSEHNADLKVYDSHNDTPLHNAALNGNIKVVKYLINGFDCCPSHTGHQGRTIVHSACEMGHIHLVDVLLSDFKLLNLSVDNEGFNPLHVAISYGQEEVAKLLIDKYNCPINFTNNYGQTALHIACFKGYTDFCCTMISEFKAERNALDKEGDTPLDKAIKGGNVKTVHILADEYGCNANIKGCESKPLLHQICGGGYAIVLQELISDFNYDPASVDEDGNTLLHTAALSGRVDVVKVIITKYGAHCLMDGRNSHGQTPLFCACISGHTESAKLLVRQGASITVRDNNSHSLLKIVSILENSSLIYGVLHALGLDSHKVDSALLQQVCEHGLFQLADTLLSEEFNFSPLTKDVSGNTLLHIAAMFGQVEIVRLLINKYSCPVDSTNFSDQTPLHLACKVGRFNVLKILISEFGANLHVRDKNGNEPLNIAALCGNTDIVTTLISEYDCDPNIRGFKGRTIFHQALAEGHTSLSKTIIESFGTSVLSCTDHDGNTPLHLAALLEQDQSVRALLYDYHAPVYVRNKDGKTALSIAANDDVRLVFRQYLDSELSNVQTVYEELHTLSLRKYSGEQIITRVFVLGNVGSGKSTLIESFKRKGVIASHFQINETDVAPRTAGIVPSFYDSVKVGRIIYYDFAGDKEYYSSHSAIVERISQSKQGNNLFFLVLNLFKHIAILKKELGYWLSFISYITKCEQKIHC